MAENDREPFDPLCDALAAGAPQMPATGLSLAALRLAPDVEQKARQLQQSAPGVVFTSGRRDLAQQANAMAGNTLLQRTWIGRTYRSSRLVTALQTWVDTHPHARTHAALAEGLLSVLVSAGPDQLAHLSRHLIGRAFDVAPHSCPASAIEALSPRQFLQHEGGLARWHVGF